VFTARAQTVPGPRPDEVDTLAWVPWGEFAASMVDEGRDDADLHRTSTTSPRGGADTTATVWSVTSHPTVPPPGSPRLLVVEDDRVIAGAVVQRLASAGYQVDAVHDGTAAVEAASAVRYDAVVLDVMLPGLDGLEVCRRIQAREPVPVLMLTARDDAGRPILGLQVGADDYLISRSAPRAGRPVAALLRRVERAAPWSVHPPRWTVWSRSVPCRWTFPPAG
jgi:CheY-like chemotaxis protein